MRFTPEFLEEIKARVAVSEVVGRRVRLKKAGREWSGLSPFKSEKTPSFFVNDAKMAWFDFSSGRNGNIFDFLMATEGLSFPEAVERLASEAGLEVPRRTDESAAQDRKRAGLLEVLELAALFFQSALAGRGGTSARAYLAGRGVAPEAQREFRLGFAPAERYALRDHLAGKGVDGPAMIEAGLLVHGEGIAVPFDRFRDRVIFPICDRSGRVIAFGGRALDPGAPAKYLNSPETPLFHKGAVLFNHHRARPVARERGTLVAVEGYMDVIALWTQGLPHVVAPLGTALTADQCDLLWRMAPEPILCFDGDAAGRRAAHRALDKVLPMIGPDRTLRFAFLPEGQDPDDLARAGGADALARVLDKARPLVDVLWTRETEGQPLDTPERRAALDRRLRERVRAIPDEGLRRHYEAELRRRIAALLGEVRSPRSSPGRARDGFGRARGAAPPPSPRGYRTAPLPTLSGSLSNSTAIAPGSYARREVEILVLVLHHPRLLDRHAEELAALVFGHPDLARFRDLILQEGVDHADDHARLAAAIDAAGRGELRRKIEAAAARLPHWCLDPEAADADAEQALRQSFALHRKARELHRELVEARSDLERDVSELNLARLRDLRDRLHATEGTEAIIEGYGISSGHRSRES